MAAWSPDAIGVAMQRELGINHGLSRDEITSLITADDVKDLAPMLVVSGEEGPAWEPESGYADPHLVTIQCSSHVVGGTSAWF